MSYGKRITWLSDRRKAKEPVLDTKSIVLFDMDGTLTPPRESFDLTLMDSLRELSRYTLIGILSGSDYNYIYDQMSYIMKKSELVYRMHLLPCNGTKWYPPPMQLDDWYKLKHEVNMRNHLGRDKYQKLIEFVLEQQAHIAGLNIPLTGEFVQYRGSMVNWCPIGRSADKIDREKFISLDKSGNLRKKYMSRLERKLTLNGLDKDITCSLGGDTSFDIYPKGWDKTYALKHFEDMEVWFVGDRCEAGGNDKALYDLLQSKGRSYKTTGPDKTKEIIDALVGHFSSRGQND